MFWAEPLFERVCALRLTLVFLASVFWGEPLLTAFEFWVQLLLKECKCVFWDEYLFTAFLFRGELLLKASVLWGKRLFKSYVFSGETLF